MDEHRPPTYPPKLAAALIRAQRAATSLGRDGHNKQIGYGYTTADAIAEAARHLLTEQGLCWVRTRVRPATRGLEQCDIGAQAYVGDIEIEWTLIHESGEAYSSTTQIAVIASKARPQDKATAAAVTYVSGQILMGLLCLDREDRDGGVRARKGEDQAHDVDQRPEDLGNSRLTPAPRGEAFVRKDSAEAERMVDLLSQLSDDRDRKADLWKAALVRANVPRVFEHEGRLYDTDRPRRLRVSQAAPVIAALEAMVADAKRATAAGARGYDPNAAEDLADEFEREMGRLEDPGYTTNPEENDT